MYQKEALYKDIRGLKYYFLNKKYFIEEGLLGLSALLRRKSVLYYRYLLVWDTNWLYCWAAALPIFSIMVLNGYNNRL